MPPGERNAVEAWINGSPARRAHAAVTAALRYSARRTTRRRTILVWSAPIAASIALLIAFPYVHHRMPSPPLVSPAGPTSRAVTGGPVAEDTILLEATRLRSGSTGKDGSPTLYRLHSNQPTRVQIALPAAAPGTTYSVDIYQAAHRDGSPVIHREDLSVIQVQSLSYLELHLPPGSLSRGEHMAELHSAGGAYRLQFAVEYLP